MISADARPWDLVIVGGGPAGCSAALVAHSIGLRVFLIERAPDLGGLLSSFETPLGELIGAGRTSGRRLAARYQRELSASGVALRTGAEVRRIAARPAGGFALTLLGRERMRGSAVLLATGTRPRRLGLPHEDAIGAHEPARNLGPRLRGRPVVVVGGGDEAAENARWLAAAGAAVTLVVRGPLRARPRIRAALAAGAPVTVLTGQEVRAFRLRGGRLAAVELASGAQLPAVRCFVRIGAEPVVPPLDPPPLLHADGRVVADAHGRTTVPGFYAAGDLVVTPERRYVAHALGLGAVAARAVEDDRAHPGHWSGPRAPRARTAQPRARST